MSDQTPTEDKPKRSAVPPVNIEPDPPSAAQRREPQPKSEGDADEFVAMEHEETNGLSAATRAGYNDNYRFNGWHEVSREEVLSRISSYQVDAPNGASIQDLVGLINDLDRRVQ